MDGDLLRTRRRRRLLGRGDLELDLGLRRFLNNRFGFLDLLFEAFLKTGQFVT
jgi:hypothetical protein